jgi:hypothetical protein
MAAVKSGRLAGQRERGNDRRLALAEAFPPRSIQSNVLTTRPASLRRMSGAGSRFGANFHLASARRVP